MTFIYNSPIPYIKSTFVKSKCTKTVDLHTELLVKENIS